MVAGMAASYSSVAHPAANDSVSRELGDDFDTVTGNNDFVFESYAIGAILISGVGLKRKYHPRFYLNRMLDAVGT
jgi:hypothetical protein